MLRKNYTKVDNFVNYCNKKSTFEQDIYNNSFY